jgi:hypothetical protein
MISNSETGTQTVVPDFTAEWQQIREDLESEATNALRIGRNLIKIRDALKPLGQWLAALREHGMSQPMAWRYITFAELPEADREPWMRVQWFSLAKAVEGRKRKDANEDSGTGQDSGLFATNNPEIPADELADRLAEIDQRFKLAIEMVNAGEAALAGEPQPPEYADDAAKWKSKLREVADTALAVIEAHLGEELRQRLLPQRP